ncbi:MAG: yqaB 1 [Candidatus Peribacteria bacterium]|nr:yqaB 1 [Candidatus Peribacteria bacterium]
MSRSHHVGILLSIPALIFDLDGTLIDSTPVYAEAAHRAFHECDVRYTEEEFHQLAVGIPLKVWLTEKGIPEEQIPIVADRRDALVIELFETKVAWREGALEAITYLSSRVPLALCTGAWTKTIEAIDTKLNLKKLFPVIIDGDAVKPRFKPDPYGLKLAAEQLGVSCQHCVYAGDQLFDMLAAKAANMTGILIPGTHTTMTEELRETTDKSFDDWNGFLEWVKTMS